MPVLETKGALSAQGYGITTALPRNYIEDVFSTWLASGTNAAVTITNGIDLNSKGGMVWLKSRTDAFSNLLFDTNRGVQKSIVSNNSNQEFTLSTTLSAFNSNGFSYGTANPNNSTEFVSWTFREQPKFFDIVTYTGTGANRTIAHNLGSVPGCIFVKRTNAVADWQVYHRSLANTQYLVLNSTATVATGATRWNSTTPTSSVFSLGTDTTVNASGGTYVAYIFAHDAGGFGNAGTDNVISCGSFTTDGSGLATVTLGYEPQWVLIKESVAAASYGWIMLDNMRGWSMEALDNVLYANLSNAESTFGGGNPTATGFVSPTLVASSTYIYIAIRRGPMKTPTVGTSVFGLNARTGTGSDATVTGGQTDDAVLIKNRGSAVESLFSSRLTGTGYLVTSSSAVEVAGTTILQANPWDVMDGVKVGTTSTITNASANTFINYLFRRAPGFFDVVCYTGTGVVGTLSHNLAAVPELMIVKTRQLSNPWRIYYNFTATTYDRLNFDSSAAAINLVYDDGIAAKPTSTGIPVGAGGGFNNTATTYINYLFASCPGVSKVGSYTGTGATLTVNCGFTSGARFVLIKRTDLVGNWYVWDSARGIVAGNDPYWLLNSAAAEVTTTDWVDTAASGFELSNSVGNLVNVVGGSYIFLSVA